MLDRREELAHLLLGQAFGKGSAAPSQMTRLDRIHATSVVLNKKVETMLERIEAAIDSGVG
jgi:hypothetical protein